MLVWECIVDAKTGKSKRRQVDMPGVNTPEDQAAADRIATATEAAATNNEATICRALEAALTANAGEAGAAEDWIAANPGTLSPTDLSERVRALTAAVARGARQRNRLIRLLLRKLDAAT